MYWRDVIDLISVTTSTNNRGVPVKIETLSTKFVNKLSITRSEFYQASVAGLKPEIAFEIRKSDYDNQEWLKYENVKYQIIRHYNKNDEIIELICKGTVV